jgi:hypothetical protein
MQGIITPARGVPRCSTSGGARWTGSGVKKIGVKKIASSDALVIAPADPPLIDPALPLYNLTAFLPMPARLLPPPLRGRAGVRAGVGVAMGETDFERERRCGYGHRPDR